MSDNDCVSRKAVYRLADDLWHLMFNLEEDGDCIDMDAVAEKIHELAKLSPVEQPMSADVYLWQRERMCHSFDSEYFDPRIDTCEECPLVEYCPKRGCLESAEAVDIVKKWAKEHPERSEDNNVN